MFPRVRSKVRPAIICSCSLIMAAERNIIRAPSLFRARLDGWKKKPANTRDLNARANSTSPKIILYMGDPCCHSMQLTGWEKIRIWWGESSRCDNCDKSRQSVALRNTAQISPSLFFPPQDDSLMSTTCNIYSHRVSDCRAVPGSTKNATY